MVDEQLAVRDIEDRRVLAVMATVPRHRFVPAAVRGEAYDDRPLPIGSGQTISQPYIVAFTIQALDIDPGARVLDVGTGSGYQAAVLAGLGAHVTSVERVASLAESARGRLLEDGHDVEVAVGDGSVAASGPEVPGALVAQLRPGGRLVMPVGRRKHGQELVRVTRGSGPGTNRRESLLPVSFVPLLGEAGWSG
jgi:protein-L-isoaspartate(D-aspartate) O-methyltransferase